MFNQTATQFIIFIVTDYIIFRTRIFIIHQIYFQVHAKHEENSEGNSVFREYNREFLLPSGTDPESIKSSLSKDGILTVEAPLPQPAITQEKK